LAYCLRLKDVAIADALVLASGYILRVVAGATAAGITVSMWLLAVCLLLFFSLALLKRYAELLTMRSLHGENGRVRGYSVRHIRAVVTAGRWTGYLAPLVLGVYVGDAQRFYPRCELLWLVCALLLYWIAYMWSMARRGRMHDDPVVFALRDRRSQLLSVLIAVALLVAV
jgi:4-hydroxybenzoate polyprenyltransferase